MSEKKLVVWVTKGLRDIDPAGPIHSASNSPHSTDCGLSISSSGRWCFSHNNPVTCKKCARVRAWGNKKKLVELKPCPLCNGEAIDRGYGIQCMDCGLWLGDNWMDTQKRTGLTYKQIWNDRPEKNLYKGIDNTKK